MGGADMQGRFWRSSSLTAGCCVSTAIPSPSPKHERALPPIRGWRCFSRRSPRWPRARTRCSPASSSTAFCSISASPRRSSTIAARGFSFMHDGPLDMRMSQGEGASAADVVNGASEAELIRIFREFGEERLAPRIARAIVADRQSRPFERTSQLAEMIARVARSRERSAATNILRRAFFRRCASTSTANSLSSKPRSTLRSSAWRRTDGWPSSAFTRSRIAW